MLHCRPSRENDIFRQQFMLRHGSIKIVFDVTKQMATSEKIRKNKEAKTQIRTKDKTGHRQSVA